MSRKLLLTGVAVVILGSAIAGVLLARGSSPAKPNTALPPATAKVVRTTLVDTKTVSGTLGYGEPVPMRAAQRGMLTWISPVGSTVKRGEPLVKVDERPKVVLYGPVPLYRTLRVGTKGSDVRQFEQNLAALGYTGFTVDDAYTAATAAAVRMWQARLGLPATGTVEVGQVVFTSGPIRIAEHTARVGDVIDGGSSVLSYTGTAKLVVIDLEVADRPLAVRGRSATVTMPGVGAVEGKISGIGTVASAPSNQSGAPDATGSGAPAATIQVTVTIADQKALGSLDAAPVDVDLISDERKDVLAVPVAALLALTNGGFGVEVVDGDRTRIIPVKTGMFASGLVQVSGSGIAESVTVGVPK
jgi:membrane fusion protein, multidrug efflux system